MVKISHVNERKLLAAFMPFIGEELIGNALIASDKLEYITSEIYKLEVRVSTPKCITRDVPNALEEELSNLDERGIITAGSSVKKGDILVGMSIPAGAQELEPEEKLLRAIFGERSGRDRDCSLRMPYKDSGIIEKIGHKTKKDEKEKLPYGINEIAEVYINIKRELKVGDVFEDAKGSKGTIIRICNIPVGVSYKKGYKNIELVGDPSSDLVSGLEDAETKNIWHDEISNYFKLTSERVTNVKQLEHFLGPKVKDYKLKGKAIIGYLPLDKVTKLVEEKITAQSQGPYSLVSRQPLWYDDITGFRIRASIRESGASALRDFPALLKEALILRSDAPIQEKTKVYEDLIKNAKV